MAFRDTLKANLDVALASTNVSVSAELPYSSAGEPLYQKNMKHVYIDEDNISKTVLFPTLDNSDVTETTTTVTAYLAVDAKNDLLVVALYSNYRVEVATDVAACMHAQSLNWTL